MHFRKTAFALAVTAAVTAAPLAQAAIFTVTGDTIGKPTFNRPLDDLSGLSVAGTAVAYDTLTFTVDAAGDYTFLTTGRFDTFTFLYSGFDPAAPLGGAIVGNDDLLVTTPSTTSGFAVTLLAGTRYTHVTTGFSNFIDAGFYSTTIGGPGVITVVPEPQICALLGVGLGIVALARRRASAGDD